MGEKKLLFTRFFVLAAEMEKLPGQEEFTFLESDQNGYIGGQLRIDAARLLLQNGLAGEAFTVGGPTRKERVEKAPLIAEMIGDMAKPLISFANTQGNFEVIRAFYRSMGGQRDEDRDGILSHSYHFQRIALSLAESKLRLYPIPAEGVILVLGTPEQQTAMRRDVEGKCRDAQYAARILNEARGCFEIQLKQWRAR